MIANILLCLIPMSFASLPIVMPIHISPEQPWLLDDRILQNTILRFSKNPNFLVALADLLSHRTLGQRLYKDLPSMKGRVFIGAPNLAKRLLQVADWVKKDHLIVIPENACGMPLAAVDLILKAVPGRHADLAYCDQVTGLVPSMISRNFLRNLDAQQNRAVSSQPLRLSPHRDRFIGLISLLPMKLRERKQSREPSVDISLMFREFCRQEDQVYQIRLFGRTLDNAPIPYLPQGPHDRALACHLQKQCELLENILGAIEVLPLQEPSQLFKYLTDYCAHFAITYPCYELQGQSEIPLAIRGLTSNPKSVGECYFRAIHFTKFLKLHAGLRNASRVVDIGCGWGLLGLGLINLIETPGSYLGLDIQREAISWAKEYIAPLNAAFSFKHMDVANSLYNPSGAVSQAEVHLPVDSDSVDLVVFSSVFTHMRREGVEQYLRESQRILRKRGVVAFSYFHSSFFGDNEDYKVRFPDNPDRMTLFNTQEIQRILSACGLVQARPQVNYGTSLNSAEPFFQTFMFATK